MNPIQQIRDDESAVSPVIGVILMVAITVILAAVIASFVLGLGDSTDDVQPNVQFTSDTETDDEEFILQVDAADSDAEPDEFVVSVDEQSESPAWNDDDPDWVESSGDDLSAGDEFTIDTNEDALTDLDGDDEAEVTITFETDGTTSTVDDFEFVVTA